MYKLCQVFLCVGEWAKILNCVQNSVRLRTSPDRPGPLVFQRATLKNWVGPGYEAKVYVCMMYVGTTVTHCAACMIVLVRGLLIPKKQPGTPRSTETENSLVL